MQTVAGDELPRQIHTGIAVDRIHRQAERIESETQVANIHATHIVAIGPDIDHSIGGQTVGADIQVERRESEMETTHLAIRHVKGQAQRRGVLRRGVGRRLAQVDPHIGIVQVQAMQRVASLGNREPGTGNGQPTQDDVHAHGGYEAVGMESSAVEH